MFFDSFGRFKLDWGKIKFDWEKWDLAESLYLKISEENRYRFEDYIIDWIRAQILKFFNAQKKNFTTSDGVTVSYLDFGSGKETLLFLHGFGDMKENFYRMSISLYKDYRLILPDLPGMGESSKDLSHVYSLENYSRWMGELIRHLQLKDFHLMGNSLGGGISLNLALTGKIKIKTLTLLDAAGVCPNYHPSIYDELNSGEVLFSIDSMEQFNGFLQRICATVPYAPTPLKYWMYRQFIENKELYWKIANDLTYGKVGGNCSREELCQMALNDKVKDIEIPTLIIWGEHDSLFPLEVAAMLHTRIKDSQLAVLENVGHIPHIENASKVIKRFTHFSKNRS